MIIKRLSLLVALVAMWLTGVAQATFSVDELNYEVVTYLSNSVKCTGLTDAAKETSDLSVIIPAYVTYDNITYRVQSIDVEAFSGCTNITKAYIASAEVGNRAFYECTSLSQITLSTSVVKLGSYCFSYTPITTISIPSSVESIAHNFVHYCDKLETISVTSSNKNFAALNGILYSKDYTTLYRIPSNHASAAPTIHPSCTTILDAFHTLLNVDTLSIPYGVKTMNYFISSCPRLKVVEIPGSVTSLINYVALHCPALEDVYVNMPNPIQLSIVAFTDDSEMYRPNLHVPRDKVDAYKAKGWTGFLSYNQDDVVPADYHDSHSVSYSITSTKTETINGTQYDGRCMVVRGRVHADVTGATPVVQNITLGDKHYAVTRIDTLAFDTEHTFSITNCANVDTVGPEAFAGLSVTSIVMPTVSHVGKRAFAGCSSLTTATWGNTLQVVGDEAFYGAPITGTVLLPVGCKALGSRAFLGAKAQVVSLPSTLTADNVSYDALRGMSSLSNIIVNFDWFDNNIIHDFTDIPHTANVYVPYELYPAVRSHPVWHGDFANLKVGAFDFCYYSRRFLLKTMYTATVTSTEPVTVDGVTYAGTAEYVFNTTLPSSTTTFTASLSETDDMCYNSSRKYLMTGLASYCLADAGMTTVDLSKMTSLRHIGTYATCGSKITSLDVPDGVITIDKDAFRESPALQRVSIGEGITVLPERIFYCDSALTEVELPSTLKTVDVYLFFDCPITKLTVKATTPPTPVEGRSEYVPMHRFDKSQCVLYVPRGSKAAYMATELWSGFKDYVEIDVATKGDVNGDGIVDITDVNRVINMVLGKVDKTSAGDIDGSGDVDITDVNGVINIMLGK